MLGSTYYSSSAMATALPKPKTLLSSHSLSLPNLCFSTLLRRSSSERGSGSGRCRTTSTSISYSNNNNIRAAAATTTTDVVAAVKVKAVATVKRPPIGFQPSNLLLELVSAELNSETGPERRPTEAVATQANRDGDKVICYEADFNIRTDFGEVGGVLVINEHDKEIYLVNIVLNGYGSGPITITCNSWVHAKNDSSLKRIFFTNKSYLPSETPSGLKQLRSEELEKLQGDGKGERKTFERIYDYDIYNDLGDSDSSDLGDSNSSDDRELARPVRVLGMKAHPYPRRCRTGRPRSKNGTTSSTMYVPRDEAFSQKKQHSFDSETGRSLLGALIPSIQTGMVDSKPVFSSFTDFSVDSKPDSFSSFTDIDCLYIDVATVSKHKKRAKSITGNSFWEWLEWFLTEAFVIREEKLRFQAPEMIKKDKFSWLSDVEFARQTLAGVNPMSIELVKEFPFVSKLDPKIYGPPESEITKELVEREIKGCMTLEEALEKKKLFVLDYHDLLLPFVHKVRELKSETTLYGSRTLFFLTKENTLRPIAIELTRPASSTKPQWRRIFTPSDDATNSWLWKLAKIHVCAHDSGYHQLVIHWLRTHCCTEPYVIAANRQLSAMHPIYRLLHPHLRYTMAINAFARKDLINAGGIIESTFSPLKYSMELSSVAYDKLWRFDMQGLPADLINRGMAVEDPTAEHGVRLTIEDYPFASDGLLIWSATKQWVSDYVNHYYQDNDKVSSDAELQEWWTEVRTKGHEDKKDEPWWPTLKTRDDLIKVLTTIIWVASAHHAAVNFGQYTFGGYFPNRPSIARTNLPVEDNLPVDDESSEAFKSFLENPVAAMLECLPSPDQAIKVIATLNVLSSHSPDEEYLGRLPEPSWSENPVINDAYKRFRVKLKEIETTIEARNADKNLRNRAGAGIVPYQLLKPFSEEEGVTRMGIPNSISI